MDNVKSLPTYQLSAVVHKVVISHQGGVLIAVGVIIVSCWSTLSFRNTNYEEDVISDYLKVFDTRKYAD